MKFLVAVALLAVSYFLLTQLVSMEIADLFLFVWALGIFTGIAVEWVIS